MDPAIILAALFGAGGTGLVPLVYTAIQNRKGGKVEDAKTLAAQLEAQAIRDMDRANRAEARADVAETKEQEALRARWDAEEYAAALRLQLIELGQQPVLRAKRDDDGK